MSGEKYIRWVFVAIFLLMLVACSRERYELQPDGSLKLLPKEDFEPEHQTVEVRSVVSGDVLRISNGETIRLIAVDAPDPGERFFEESRTAHEELLLGKKVKLLFDQKKKDSRGRSLCYVLIPTYQGNNLRRVEESTCSVANFAMIRSGSARYQDSSPNHRYRGWLRSAEVRAREERLGIWSP